MVEANPPSDEDGWNEEGGDEGWDEWGEEPDVNVDFE